MFFQIIEQIVIESQKKADEFKKRFLSTVETFKLSMFSHSGQYIFGGKMARLNEFRGSYDPIELNHTRSMVCVLEENNLITSEGSIKGIRNEPHDIEQQDLYAYSCFRSRFDEILPTMHSDLQDALLAS